MNVISFWLRPQRLRKFLETLRDQVRPQGSVRGNKRHCGAHESSPLAVLAGGLVPNEYVGVAVVNSLMASLVVFTFAMYSGVKE